MENIKAYKCSHCSKVLESYSGMWKHEKKCFWNPASKSCIVCKSFTWDKLVINNKPISDHEQAIYNYKVEGTYYEANDDFGPTIKLLEKEYEYLHETEPMPYCETKKCILKPLCTGCDLFKL